MKILNILGFFFWMQSLKVSGIYFVYSSSLSLMIQKKKLILVIIVKQKQFCEK